ncbi:MAG: hypothetical protein R6X33_15695, partial [Candidatus Brocadiia bacterium]
EKYGKRGLSWGDKDIGVLKVVDMNKLWMILLAVPAFIFFPTRHGIDLETGIGQDPKRGAAAAAHPLHPGIDVAARSRKAVRRAV